MADFLFGTDPLVSIVSATAPLPSLAVGVALTLCFIFGACLGSFANASALRLVREEDFVSGASRCRTCDRALRWHENMPILGYLRLRGRCGCGTAKLSPRYLAVEVILGGVAVGYAVFLPPMLAAGLMIAATIAMISLLTDLEAMVLHPALLTFMGAVGLALAGFGSFGLLWWPISVTEALAGIVIAGLVPFAINQIYRLIRQQNGFGEGDFWLMAAIGGWIGPVGALCIFFAATFLGAIIGVAMISLGRASTTTKLPFGLFISVVFILCPTPNILLF